MPELPTQALVKRDDVIVSKLRPSRPVHHSGTGATVNRNNILYALFKHKKKILACAAVGLLAAGLVALLYPPTYESQAKLMVRYVVERSTVDALDTATSSSGLSRTSDYVIGSEIEILTSWDLAVQVADAVGPKRLLARQGGNPTKEAAAATVASGLEATAHKGSNIIFVAYKNRDPELTTLVLNELVNRYFNKHLEVHRSAGAFDFVTQQTDQVRARLNQTEDALKELKEKAGIVSLDNTIAALSSESARTEEQLQSAEADFAEQQARLRQMGGVVVETAPSPAETKAPENVANDANKAKEAKAEIPTDAIEQYQSLISRLPQLRQARQELLTKYTFENQMVKANQAEISEIDRQRRDLEKKYPDLAGKTGVIGSSKGQLDPASETARLAGLQARKDALAARLRDVQVRTQQLAQLSPQIADLERQKQLQETNYKYFEGTLEKARVDEALDPSKIPNISAVQRPSQPIIVTTARNKIVMGLAASGLGLGVLLALLKEVLLNRTIKQPGEIERSVGVIPLMSIPFRKQAPNGVAQKPKRGSDALTVQSSGKNLAPWEPNHFIRPFCEAIRDRIGLYFELNQLTHKPKLVGVAGFGDKAGTSTLAAGLAAALSETNDGKVLLVDVNLGPDQVHPFFRGRPAYTLNAALTPNGEIHAAAENLYLASVGTPSAGPAQLGLKKFFDLMPNLKASDFDYIIFDMPPLTQTSPTWGMSAFMDKVLLVVEAEKDNQEVVKRGYHKLMAERDNVSVVLNKRQSYGSRWLELEG
jgi:polysaccharide biosynthesis transport protein